MRSRTALKILEIIQNIKEYPNEALHSKLNFIKEHIEREVTKNEIRKIAINKSLNLKKSLNNKEN